MVLVVVVLLVELVLVVVGEEGGVEAELSASDTPQLIGALGRAQEAARVSEEQEEVEEDEEEEEELEMVVAVVVVVVAGVQQVSVAQVSWLSPNIFICSISMMSAYSSSTGCKEGSRNQVPRITLHLLSES